AGSRLVDRERPARPYTCRSCHADAARTCDGALCCRDQPGWKIRRRGDRAGVVCVWELATSKLAQRFEVPILYTYDPKQRKRSIGGIRSLAFLPDGRLLAVGGIGQVNNVDGLAGPAHVELWDWRKPEPRLMLE